MSSISMLQEYEQQKTSLEDQPTILQRSLENQARQIAEGLVSNTPQVRFSLPDRVVVHVNQAGQGTLAAVPETQRAQRAGIVWASLTSRETRAPNLSRLQKLDHSPDRAIATSTSLLRFAIATHLVSNLLPAGRSVTYRTDDDVAIPSIPVSDRRPESALTQASVSQDTRFNSSTRKHLLALLKAIETAFQA